MTNKYCKDCKNPIQDPIGDITCPVINVKIQGPFHSFVSFGNCQHFIQK